MIKVKLFQGHVLEVLKQIPDNSIDCIITSPPYWGLRCYPDPSNVVWDGDSNCEHEFELETQKDSMDRDLGGMGSIGQPRTWEKIPTKQGFCKKCGAWFGQLGLEPSLDLYIKHLLQITAELKRVLKPTGVMFWNHGSSYAGSMGKHKGWSYVSGLTNKKDGTAIDFEGKSNLPAKCETLQNFRLVLRMIDEQGWILRNSIVWYKPNHLPSSVKDRFTNAYEPIFMLVKNKRYYFNLDAVREPLKTFSEQRKHDMERILKFGKFLNPVNLGYNSKFLDNPSTLDSSFNYRVREAKKCHFEKIGVRASEEELKKYDTKGRPIGKYNVNWDEIKNNEDSELTLGGIGRFYVWQRECGRINNIIGKNPGDVWIMSTEPFKGSHFAVFPTSLVRRCIKAACPENGIVLDPFVGSGTTIKVAIEERRNCIGIDIVPDYIKMTEERCNLVGLQKLGVIEYEKRVVGKAS